MRNEEQEESQHETRQQEVTHNQDSSTHQYNHAGRNKEGHEETTQKLNQARHFIKEKYLQKSASSLTGSWASPLHQKKRRLQMKAKSTPPQQQAQWQK
jgi:hypothetical protein